MRWRFNGVYYVRPWGFSLNESEYPNLHISWRWWFVFYLALSQRMKLRWTS